MASPPEEVSMPTAPDRHVKPNESMTYEILVQEFNEQPTEWANCFMGIGNYSHQVSEYASTVATEYEVLKSTSDSMAKENTRLRTENIQLRAHLEENGSRSPAIQRSKKIPDPFLYNGEKDKLDKFLADLRFKLLANDDRFPLEQSKLAYAMSRTTGKAKEQVLPYIKEGAIELENMTAFYELMENAFGDPNRKGTAQYVLQNLRQANQDFSSYLAEFNRHVQYTGWNEEAKKSFLQAGLSAELRYHLVIVDSEGMILQKLIKTCLSIDNRLRAAQNASRIVHRNPVRAAMAPATLPAEEPMDLSAIRTRPRGPLDQKERMRRLENNLCLYCGGQGHKAIACPNKPAAALR